MIYLEQSLPFLLYAEAPSAFHSFCLVLLKWTLSLFIF